MVLAGWTTGIDAVSAAIMHDTVMNEYVLDSGTASLTDWVVTYPTKRYYVATVRARRPSCSNAISRPAWARATTSPTSSSGTAKSKSGRSAAGILAAASGAAEVRAVLGSEHRHVEQLEPVRVTEQPQHQHAVPERLGQVESRRRRDRADPPADFHDEPDVQRSASRRIRDHDVLQRSDSDCDRRQHPAIGLRCKLQAQDHDADPIRRLIEAIEGRDTFPPFFFCKGSDLFPDRIAVPSEARGSSRRRA